MSITLIFCALLFLTGFIFYFNRTPERSTPDEDVLVSPANGEIIHIETVSSNEVTFFKNDIENTLTVHDITPPYTVVVIEMDLRDIHAQRAPIDGEIVYQEHVAGAHKNALSSPNLEKLANVNEKNIVVFENDKLSVGVVQVAGMAARRIRSFIEQGDTLGKGEIYGRIILGSQVVVIFPAEITELLVKTGDILIDGESIIAQY